MSKRVVFIEAPGGSDKGDSGHRRDTMPMVEALRAKGWHAETLFYTDEKRDEIFDYTVKDFDAYVPRVNPGSIPSGETIFFDMLRALTDEGVIGMPHPDAMIGYGAEDALVRLTDTDLVPDDTFSYYDLAELKENFPVALSRDERVLKQNRGSTGEGIWRVAVFDERPYEPGDTLPLDTAIKCTEAVDNHVEMHTLGAFMDFCDQYLVGDGGMLLDMPFMPRIVEGGFGSSSSAPILCSSCTRSQLKRRTPSPQRCSPGRSTASTTRRTGQSSRNSFMTTSAP